MAELGSPSDCGCGLGNECPYAGSMRWLYDERLKREQSDGEQAALIDRLSDKLQAAILQVEKFQFQILAVSERLERHERRHRVFEVATLSLAASLGALFAHFAK